MSLRSDRAPNEFSANSEIHGLDGAPRFTDKVLKGRNPNLDFTKVLILLGVYLLAAASTVFYQVNSEDHAAEKIIAMERAALDRWGKGGA